MTKPLVIQYSNLLWKHGNSNAQPVQEFLKTHEADKVFIRRAKALDKVWNMAREFLR